MNGGVAVGLIVATGVLGLLSTVLGRRARRLELRLESLARPLHELRGGLTALELGLSYIERSGLREGLDGCVDSLRLSLERATLGARDMDAFRRGQQGAVDGEAEVSLNTLVLRSARAWSLLAPSYGATLELDWRAGPVGVFGHAGRLHQALDNLIANALEHGGGRVLVEGERRGRLVHVQVSDGGPGFPRRLEEVLAENGKRSASRAPLRGHGLSIAREVIREHGGRLRVEAGRNGPGLVVELPVAGGASVPSGVAPSDARYGVRDVASNAA